MASIGEHRPSPTVVGLVLAAGAGSRFGMPKALVRDPDGTAWVARRCEALQHGGCSRTLVVLGARAERARRLVPAGAEVVVAPDWHDGLSASLRAGLDAATRLRPRPVAVLVALVDTPGLSPTAVRRLLDLAVLGTTVLARAVYDGTPGHPVLVGREHWQPLGEVAAGDVGAAAYLRRHRARTVECSDVAEGADIDVDVDLPPGDAPSHLRDGLTP